MKSAIFKALNINEEEGTKVFLFVLQSLFLGGFYGTFDIGAHTLFLQAFEESMIPKAYTLSGVVGIVMTSIYSKMQSRISFSKLAVGNLLAISIITILLRFGFELTQEKWLVFLIFMMMGPLNIVGLVGFWGTASRIFTLREGKRLFGVIDAGQVLGIIIASYAIPLIPILLKTEIQTKNLLLVSSLSVMVAFLVQLVISRKFNLNISLSVNAEGAQIKDKTLSFREFIKNKYIRYMALFVMFSMLVAFFVSYSFLVVTKENYPEESAMAGYLGTFTGSMMIVTFLIKTFVYSKLMKTYGLKISLILSPVLIGFFTIVAALVGSFFGYTIDAKNFILFFLIISLSRLFNKALKDAIELPSFKILYQSLDASIRFDVQAKIDGTINEFSALFSGIVLTVLGLLGFFTLIFFSYTLVIILVGWTFVSIYLYMNYKKSLEKSLDESKDLDQQSILLSNNINHIIRQELESSAKKDHNKSMYLARLIEPGIYYNRLHQLLYNSSIAIKEFALNQISSRKVFDVLNQLESASKDEKDKAFKNKVNQVHKQLSEALKNLSSVEKITKLGQSRNPDERILCAQLISKLKLNENVQQLIVLLRDLEPEVRKAALLSAGKLKNPELIPAVIDNLSSYIYQRYATAAIEEFGEQAIDHLEQAFYKTGLNDDHLLLIVRLMGSLKGEKAKQYLLPKIRNNNREIAKQAMLSLRMCNYVSTEFERHTIHQSIEQYIGIIGWNMAAILSLGQDEIYDDLRKALEEENLENFEILFHLLALAYDAQSVQLVRKNLDTGTAEGIGYAIELLDLFVAEEIKGILFPVFEDTSPIDKIKVLQNEFPIELMEMEELLNSIITRDPNYLNRWSRVCAIKLIEHIDGYKVGNDLLAHLFNADELIRQTVGILVKKIDPDAYEKTAQRIDAEIKEKIDNDAELTGEKKNELIYQKNFYLKNLDQFKNVPGRILTKLGDHLIYREINPQEDLLKQKGEEHMEYFFLIKGKVSIQYDSVSKTIDNKSFINEMHTILPIAEIKLDIIDKSSFYTIARDIFEIIVFNNPEIAKVIIREDSAAMADTRKEFETVI